MQRFFYILLKIAKRAPIFAQKAWMTSSWTDAWMMETLNPIKVFSLSILDSERGSSPRPNVFKTEIRENLWFLKKSQSNNCNCLEKMMFRIDNHKFVVVVVCKQSPIPSLPVTNRAPNLGIIKKPKNHVTVNPPSSSHIECDNNHIPKYKKNIINLQENGGPLCIYQKRKAVVWKPIIVRRLKTRIIDGKRKRKKNDIHDVMIKVTISPKRVVIIFPNVNIHY